MIGKSTVARKISAMYELQTLSTDDIGEMLQTVVPINPMKDRNYLDYYENVELETQIRDLQEYHEKMEPAITRMINIHSDWGQSMIIEGYAVYPAFFQKVRNGNVDAVWLIASEELLAERLKQSKAFEGASEKAKENYFSRSIWHNRFLEEQCKLKNCSYIKVTGRETTEELAEKIIKNKTELFTATTQQATDQMR